MLQVVQNLGNGQTSLEEIPSPSVRSGHILVKTYCSLVSTGTERMLVGFGQSNLIDKARSQPEKVRQVLDKVKSDGLAPTYEAVKRKLDTPIPLGYSAVGQVIAVGEGQSEFNIGDRVVTNGPHAEIVSVPFNLAAKIPDSVSYEEASFTVLSSIGLQGIRLLDLKFGETVVVVGLGLIGLLSAQLLKSSGCDVIGTDVDPSKVKLANKLGINAVNVNEHDAVKYVNERTNNIGADGVLITASSSSNEIIRQSADMSRKRGKIVLVGVVGLDIDRSSFYHKELTFQVSCSYGPGRYDQVYEKQGIDYPLPYVRWTEKRNFEAILNALEKKQLNVEDLISEKIKVQEFDKIYSKMTSSESIASLLLYDFSTNDAFEPKSTIHVVKSIKPSKGSIAIVGTGNYTQATLLPSLVKGIKELKDAPRIKCLVSADGLSSTNLAKKYKIPFSTTDFDSILNDSDISTVIVATRHDLHASMATQILEANKNVFVEKPLALNFQELDKLESVIAHSDRSLMVGYNRRFSPHSHKIKKIIGEHPDVMSITATINAGHISSDHWVHDLKIGGGRIIGEACHLVDLMIYFTGSLVSEVCVNSLGTSTSLSTDNATINLKFKNGSIGTINYFSNGHKSYAKERLEVFYQGKNLIIDNFRVSYAYGYGKTFSSTLLKTNLDKGHNQQFLKYANFVKHGGSPLINFVEIDNSTRAVLSAIESLKEKKWVGI